MREKDIEQTFARAVKKAGGIALKLTSPGTAGMPDRLVIFRGGKAGFVELKQPGQKPRAIQQHRIELLRSFGFTTLVLDHTKNIPEVIHAIQYA